jgi:hypothetical protein
MHSVYAFFGEFSRVSGTNETRQGAQFMAFAAAHLKMSAEKQPSL